MAQGATKGLQKKTSSSRHAAKAASQPKKGKRYIAPKKTAAVKSAALHKVFTLPFPFCKSENSITQLNPPNPAQELSAKINRSIEQQVATAASSGKLTIMKNVALEG